MPLCRKLPKASLLKLQNFSQLGTGPQLTSTWIKIISESKKQTTDTSCSSPRKKANTVTSGYISFSKRNAMWNPR